MRLPTTLLACLVALVIIGNNFATYQSWKKGGYRRAATTTSAVAKMALAAAR